MRALRRVAERGGLAPHGVSGGPRDSRAYSANIWMSVAAAMLMR